MIQRVIETEGIKSLQPLSNSVTGSTLPLGTVIDYEGGIVPAGYLKCDGSTFDKDKYPALYMLLGSNTLPTYPVLEEVPDWTKAVNITATPYTVPSYGYVILTAGHSNGTAGSCSINDKAVVAASGAYGTWNDWNAIASPVKPGDVCSWSGGHNSITMFTSTETGRYKAIKAVSGFESDQENTLFNLIKKYTEGDVLWENSTPTTFAASTVTVDNLSNYKYFEITWNKVGAHKSTISTGYEIRKYEYMETNYTVSTGYTGTSNIGHCLSRQFTISGNDIEFTAATYQAGNGASYGDAAGYLVPVKIVGKQW